MQTVSEKWKEIHKQTLLNESFVEVSLDIGDPDALEVATPEDNGAVYISDSSNLTKGVDKTPTPYCTLEQNLWCLDGNRKAIPKKDFTDKCYVSDVLSDETCVFSGKQPIITINFKQVFSKAIPGVTITWSETYGEFADTFSVIAYNEDTIIAEKEVTGNRSVKSIVFTDIVYYDRIVVIIKKWCLPNHRARVEEIFVGLNKVYGKTDLFDYSHTQSVDPVSTSLPKVEIKFSIDNVNGEYNPYNANGLAKYLMERQEIKARYGLKIDEGSIEWIDAGTFYLSEWYAKQNGMTADFTARDIFEFLSDIYTESHSGYGRSLYDLAEMILTKADLPRNSDGSPKWRIHESLIDIITFSPLPEDTLANCLQLIANAGRCVIYQDRSGTLCIEPLEISITDYEINRFNSYSNSEITLSKPIKEIIVKTYQYLQVEDGVEEKIGEITVPIGTMGETITVDNPLITPANAPAVGAWVGEYLKNRMILDSSWRADVRLDALDIVKNVNDYSSNRVRMTDVEFKFNGAFSGTGKGRVIPYD